MDERRTRLGWARYGALHRYLEEWKHAGKLAAISSRAKKMQADELEGRRAKMSQMMMALYVNSFRCLRCK
jgi:hypothetical protein